MASAPPESSASTSLTPEETAAGADAPPPREATAASASAGPVLRRHSTPDLHELVRLRRRRGRRRPGRAAAHGAAAVGVGGLEGQLAGEGEEDGERRETVAVLGLRCSL